MSHKLLLVDDNSTMERLVEMALEHEDIEVSTARGVQEALDHLQTDRPDIILADERYAISEAVRNEPGFEAIPIVLLRRPFGSGEEPAGYDGTLDNPLQPPKMIELIKRLLSRGGGDVPVNGSSSLTLDQYFDQLDVAFQQYDGTEGAAWQSIEEGWPFQAAPVAPPVAGTTPKQPRPAPEKATRSTAREKGNGPPAPAAAPTASASPAIEPSVEVSDEFIQRVADRVFERLNDRLVRSTATEMVSRLAKWLVADEVERAGKSK